MDQQVRDDPGPDAGRRRGVAYGQCVDDGTVQDLLRRQDDGVEALHEAAHERDVASLREVDEPSNPVDRGGERLLHEHRDSRLQQISRDVLVRDGRGRDDGGVEATGVAEVGAGPGAVRVGERSRSHDVTVDHHRQRQDGLSASTRA